VKISMPKIGGARGFKAPKVVSPMKPLTKIHPAAQARIRLPQGIDNTSEAAPAPWLPGVGRV
jgi:hypothetical protein